VGTYLTDQGRAALDEHAATVERMERRFHQAAGEVLADQPRRTAIGAAIGESAYRLLHRFPDRIVEAIQGDDYWHPRFSTALEVTVCRLLGHRWELMTSGHPPRQVGHSLFCRTCTDMPSTDDLDRFRPGSRHRRDLAAAAYELNVCWYDAWRACRDD
jgi:hypothetical protein